MLHDNMRFWRKICLGRFIDPFGQDSFRKVLLTRSVFEWNRIHHISQEHNWRHFGSWRFMSKDCKTRGAQCHSRERERERANQKFLPLNPGRWKSGKFLLPSFNFAQRYMQKSHILQQLPEICARIKKIDASALPWKIHPNPARLFKFLCNPRGSCGRYPNETPWIFISIRSVLAQVKHKSPTLERTERKSLSKMHPRSEIIQPNRTHIQSTYSKNQPTREPTSANPSPGEAQAA